MQSSDAHPVSAFFLLFQLASIRDDRRHVFDHFQEKFILGSSSVHRAGPRFKLGRILATAGALEVIADAHILIVDLLIRYVSGD